MTEIESIADIRVQEREELLHLWRKERMEKYEKKEEKFEKDQKNVPLNFERLWISEESFVRYYEEISKTLLCHDRRLFIYTYIWWSAKVVFPSSGKWKVALPELFGTCTFSNEKVQEAITQAMTAVYFYAKAALKEGKTLTNLPLPLYAESQRSLEIFNDPEGNFLLRGDKLLFAKE